VSTRVAQDFSGAAEEVINNLYLLKIIGIVGQGGDGGSFSGIF
jgi:hypothetical protein